MLTEISSTMKEIKDVLANDPTSELIDYLKEKSRKQTHRDNMFMPLITNLFSPQPTAAANARVYYPPHNGMTQPSYRSPYAYPQQTQPGRQLNYESFQNGLSSQILNESNNQED